VTDDAEVLARFVLSYRATLSSSGEAYMSGSADQTGSAGVQPRPGEANGARPSPGVTVSAHGNIGIRNSDIAGRDVNKNTTTINNKQRNVKIGLGLGSVALIAVLGVHALVKSSSSSVVYEAGAAGATATLRQLQQAEANGDASSWCMLASSNDSSTCQSLLSNGYSSPESAKIRSQVPQISVSEPTGSGDSYSFTLTYQGHSYPDVQLIWTGQRWELSPTIYYAGVNDGGVFSAVIETAHGQGAILGVPLG
jgi:hypothetical protein